MMISVLYSIPPVWAPTRNHPLEACTSIIPKICCTINQTQIRRTICPDAKTNPPLISTIVTTHAMIIPAGNPLVSKNSPNSGTVENEIRAMPCANIIKPTATLKKEFACDAEINGNLVK